MGLIAAGACAGIAAWLSLGILTVTAAPGGVRIGILPPWWLPALLVAAAIAGARALRLSAQACQPLWLSLLLWLPWLPIPVPDVFLAFTGPMVVLVWASIAMLVFVSSGLAAKIRAADVFRDPRRAPRAAAAIACTAFLAAWCGQRVSPMGDEPHYLLLTQSILLDHDVRVGNNYDRGDYKPYFNGPLDPHVARSARNGELYSFHSAGLPSLVAPAFALGGYRAAVVWMALLAALGTWLVWSAAYALTRDAGAAWFAWSIVALTAPGLIEGALVYPDAVSGLVLGGATLALVRANESTTREPWRVSTTTALAAGVGVLPWLHVRLALPAAIVWSALFLHVARDVSFATNRRRHLAGLIAPAALAVGTWLMFFWTTFGVWNPAAAYGDQVPLEPSFFASGFLGLTIDQQFGLIANSPVYLVAIAGLWPLIATNRRLAIEVLLIVIPYAVASAMYRMWWGGASPPARFLLPIVFPLAIAAAAAWRAQRPTGRAISMALLGVSIAIGVTLAGAGDGALAYNPPTGRARWLDWASPLVDLPSAFPSVFRGDPTGHPDLRVVFRELVVPAGVWTIVLAAGALLISMLGRRLTDDSRVLYTPAVLSAVVVMGISGAWILSRPDGGSVIAATRSQLEYLRAARSNVGKRQRLEVQLFPPAILELPGLTFSHQIPSVVIRSSPLDKGSTQSLLFLTDVPPGMYSIHARGENRRGELTLGIGRATVPAATWSAADHVAFDLPVTASALVVTGNAAAMDSIDRVELVPFLGTLAHSVGRARDAARYGSTVVYALDDRIALEPGGFWVFGGRRPDVVFATDQGGRAIDLEIRNGPIDNRIELRTGRWSSARDLAPGEHWSLRIPRTDEYASVVNFHVARSFEPAEVDPASRDRRPLGVWVEVR